MLSKIKKEESQYKLLLETQGNVNALEYLLSISNFPFYLVSSLLTSLLISKVYPNTTTFTIFIVLWLYPLAVEPCLLLFRNYYSLLLYIASFYCGMILPFPASRLTKLAIFFAKGRSFTEDLMVMAAWMFGGWQFIAYKYAQDRHNRAYYNEDEGYLEL